MICSDIMKKVVVYLNKADSAQVAAKLMADSNVGFLPVCDGGKCVGTLTDRDLALRVVSDNRPASTLVGDIMTKDVIACSPDDPLEKAAEMMAEAQVSRLLINDENGFLAGILSFSDLPKPLADQAFEGIKEISEQPSPPSQ